MFLFWKIWFEILWVGGWGISCSGLAGLSSGVVNGTKCNGRGEEWLTSRRFESGLLKSPVMWSTKLSGHWQLYHLTAIIKANIIKTDYYAEFSSSEIKLRLMLHNSCENEKDLAKSILSSLLEKIKWWQYWWNIYMYMHTYNGVNKCLIIIKYYSTCTLKQVLAFTVFHTDLFGHAWLFDFPLRIKIKCEIYIPINIF